MQYTCIQDAATINKKYDQIALISCITIFISLCFLVQIRRLYQGGKIAQLEWDLATITAGDYSVEWEIMESTYRHWYDNIYKVPGGDFEKGIAAAYSMKVYLKKEVEKFLHEQLAIKNATHQADAEAAAEDASCTIADITFSFNNGTSINLLKARGGFIALQKFDEMRAEEVKIQAAISDYQNLTRPTAAFITFESDNGFQLALDLAAENEKLPDD